MHSLVIFTTTKSRSKNHFGDPVYLSLNTAWIGTQQYTVYRISTPATLHQKLRRRLPRYQGHTLAQRLRSSTQRLAKDAHSKERLHHLFSWVPRSPKQLQKIILLLLKARSLEGKSLSRYRNTPFLISVERTVASTSEIGRAHV